MSPKMFGFKKILGTKHFFPKEFWITKYFGSKNILITKKFGYKKLWILKQNYNKKIIRSKKSWVQISWINKIWVKQIFGSHEPFFKVWLKLDWYLLRYSIKFKLGQMLHGQMLMGQMYPRKLTTHADSLIEFG